MFEHWEEYNSFDFEMLQTRIKELEEELRMCKDELKKVRIELWKSA